MLSFSHFLPRVENNPEKRYLTYPNLANASTNDDLHYVLYCEASSSCL